MQKHEYYKDERYHHGAAMGQKNVKVCRSLQQFGDEKPVNVTVCRDFHRLSIPASGIELFSETLDFIVFSRVSDFFLLVLRHLWGKNFYFFYLGIPFFF